MQCCQLCLFCNQLREKSRAGETEKMSDDSIATRLAGKISQKDQGTGQRPTNVLLLTSLDDQFFFFSFIFFHEQNTIFQKTVEWYSI